MQTQPSSDGSQTTTHPILQASEQDSRVVVAVGYGVSVTVNRGHLVVKDGSGRYRRERRYPRISAMSRDGFARLVITTSDGYVSFDAMDWCEKLGIAVVQYRRDGTPLMTSPVYMGDARIRKTQVLCGTGLPLESTGTEILRFLLESKLHGQHERIEQWGDEKRILESKRWLARFREATTPVKMVSAEGHVASAYWSCWNDRVFVPFTPGDLSLVPSHWWRFTNRAGITSEANGYKPSNRNATDPVNAMLNYAYSICLTESVYACHASGLDPSFGIGHGIDKDSPGMALDLVEPLRPVADGIILSMLDYGRGIPFSRDGIPAYFTKDSFRELDNGQCVINPPVTYSIATEVSLAVAPVAAMYAEKIVSILMRAAKITNPARTGALGSKDPRLSDRVTASSLHKDLTPTDIVPDSLWNIVSPLIPPEPQYRGNKPNPRADNRAVLAGIIAHEVYGMPWSQIPAGLGVDRKTCRRRFDEWKSLGAWEQIRTEVMKPGITYSVS